MSKKWTKKSKKGIKRGKFIEYLVKQLRLKMIFYEMDYTFCIIYDI